MNLDRGDHHEEQRSRFRFPGPHVRRPGPGRRVRPEPPVRQR